MSAARQSGFTLWELILVVVLVVLLFMATIENLLPLRGAAERAQVQHTVGALRSALGMQAAERVLRERSTGLVSLTAENPLEWLAVTPPQAPADADSSLEAMPAGTWNWLPQSNMLAYRLKYPEYVEGAHANEWLRFQVRLEGSAAAPSRLELRELDPAHWTIPDVAGEVLENEYVDEPAD